MKHKYHWFTIVELLISMIVISMALLSILGLLRVAVTYTNKTRQETIAVNIAREWIEWVYILRNTNRLRWSWEKDKHWLCNDWTCTQWLSGNLALHTLEYEDDTYGRIPYYNTIWSLSSFEDSILWDTNLLLSTGNFIWGLSPDTAGKFYRAIIGLWLYQKDTNVVWGNLINCPNWNAWSDYINWIDINGNSFVWQCSDSHPKEYRFCSRVEYEKNFQWKVELCGAITNYQE